MSTQEGEIVADDGISVPSIKFSHTYQKLNALSNTGRVDENIVLLEVLRINLEDLHEPFLSYDTEGKFVLPRKGKYLLLIFEKEGGIFTTIRRETPSKLEWYTSQIGHEFQLRLEER